jgi:hypothetical protein
LSGVLLAAALAEHVRAADRSKPDAETKPSQDDSGILSVHDRELLERLLKEFVFDPQGCDYVLAPVKRHSARAQLTRGKSFGWRLPTAPGQPRQIAFVDGEKITLSRDDRVQKVDFIAACHEQYVEMLPAVVRTPTGVGPGTRRIDRKPVWELASAANNSDLVNAAWLHRLDRDKLAALALRRARETSSDDAAMIADLKRQLATVAHDAMFEAYRNRSDEAALALGERLMQLYPEQAKPLAQTDALIAELKRRAAKGTFGKQRPDKLPAGFETWVISKKVDYFVDLLDELDDSKYPLIEDAYFFWGRGRHVKALIDLGDAAVPRLIDIVEHDNRLTRSTARADPFRGGPAKIVQVRVIAFDILLAIFRVRSLDPTQGQPDYDLEGQEHVTKVVEQLRAYWKANAARSRDERTIRVLANSRADPGACRTAADALTGKFNGYRPGPLGIHLQPSDEPPLDPRRTGKGGMYLTPTEAILTALDREIAGVRANATYGSDQARFAIAQIEQAYLGALIDLHDQSAAAEFVRRYKAAETLFDRMIWALAADGSGDSGPVKELARCVEVGKVMISGHDFSGELSRISGTNNGTTELADLLQCLVYVKLPEADRALAALANPAHPLDGPVSELIDRPVSYYSVEDSPLGHPYCLTILGRELADTTPTDGMYEIDGQRLEYKRTGMSTSSGLPGFLVARRMRNTSAGEAVCDRAACHINQLAFGLPLVHPLRKDRDPQLDRMKQFMTRYGNHFRRIRPAEKMAIGRGDYGTEFIVDIAPLTKPATADDFESGQAIFHLPRPGRLAPLKLPAGATLKKSDPENPSKALIVQAEIDADGKTVYGIIGRYFTRSAKAEELTDIQPLDSSAAAK